MSGSQEEASAVADGRLSEGSRSSQVSPRTPDGPSDTRMRRSPIFSIGQVVQKSRPVSSWTFSSRVSAASAPAIFESLVRAVMTPFLLVRLRGLSLRGRRRNGEVPFGQAGLDGTDQRLGYLYPGPPLVLGLNQHPRRGCVISSLEHLLHGRLILPPLLAIPPIF